MEELVALQEIGNNTIRNKVDLLFGGGKCLFLPSTDAGSCRTDDVDVWGMARSNGYTQISSKTEFDSLNVNTTKLPLMGLFASEHMSYEIDRSADQEPSLSEMVYKGLNVLNSNSQNGPGFFVMIEGARIDMAAHDNDPATHLHDIVAYWQTVTAVHKFIDMHPDTAMVATSDHETGGLTLGIDPDYAWYPRVLAPIKRSAASICSDMKHVPVQSRVEFVSGIVFPYLMGINDASQEEILSIVRASSMDSQMCRRFIGQAVSARAHIGWTTGGHTGGDVGLYAYGAGTSDLRGSYENVQISNYMAKYLGVDVGPVSKLLANEV
ncbi:vacuolar alkaline phosphatase, partial [Linderina pennispora]